MKFLYLYSLTNTMFTQDFTMKILVGVNFRQNFIHTSRLLFTWMENISIVNLFRYIFKSIEHQKQFYSLNSMN